MDTTTISRARVLAASGAARRIREGARLSLNDVASEIGVSAAAVSRWERGLRVPRAASARAYGDLLDKLMGGVR